MSQEDQTVTDQTTRPQFERIIAGLSEGVLLIEPEGEITYANRAALRMHGVRDLEALGLSVKAYRSNYILTKRAKRGHPIERVIKGEVLDDVEVHVARRDNPEQDWAHRLRSMVMKDAQGQPDYIVVIITDVSEMVEAEERFEATFAANPAPSVICRLADQRFIKVNEGFLAMTGYKRDAVLGRSLHDIDLLRQAERRDLALERLRLWETIPQMEASLAVPADGEKLVIVGGQPIEISDEPCMLFTFADLEPRRRAEARLRHSEEHFVRLFQLAPVPLSVSSAKDYRLRDINQAFCALTAIASEEAIGRTVKDLDLWVDDEEQRRFERELAKSGQVRGFEAKLRTGDGSQFDALLAADAITIDDEASVLCAFQDISARKRSETELVAAIEAVMSDASWFAQAVVEKLAALRKPSSMADNRGVAGLADLTTREREVLGLVCQGLGNEEIGARLAVAPNTIRNHLAALYRKLGVNRRSGLIVWARERGVAEGDLPQRKRRQTRPKQGQNKRRA